MEEPTRATFGKERDRTLLAKAKSFVYKKTDQGDLLIHFYLPYAHQKTDHRTTVVFFHGGVWDHSMPAQFSPHCLHFANRGCVCATIEYRVAEKHASAPEDAIEDAQSAILWLKQNHMHFGINPEQIVVGGAGSGAHIALCAATHKSTLNDGFYSCQVNALILFSAIVNTTKKGVGHEHFVNKGLAKKASPHAHIRRKQPPMIFFHGKADLFSPIEHVERYAKNSKRKGNRCQLDAYDRASHTFFNFNVSEQNFEFTINAADAFLVELGFIEELGIY